MKHNSGIIRGFIMGQTLEVTAAFRNESKTMHSQKIPKIDVSTPSSGIPISRYNSEFRKQSFLMKAF